jgi:hypothetical protein
MKLLDQPWKRKTALLLSVGAVAGAAQHAWNSSNESHDSGETPAAVVSMAPGGWNHNPASHILKCLVVMGGSENKPTVQTVVSEGQTHGNTTVTYTARYGSWHSEKIDSAPVAWEPNDIHKIPPTADGKKLESVSSTLHDADGKTLCEGRVEGEPTPTPPELPTTQLPLAAGELVFANLGVYSLAVAEL